VEGILAPWHWAILIVVVLLIFGPRKLPELGNSLGKSIRGFKKGMSDAQDELKDAMAETPSDTAAGQRVVATLAEPPAAVSTAATGPEPVAVAQPPAAEPLRASQSSNAGGAKIEPPLSS
jgi:sec-independent protein translocase protein TatA